EAHLIRSRTRYPPPQNGGGGPREARWKGRGKTVRVSRPRSRRARPLRRIYLPLRRDCGADCVNARQANRCFAVNIRLDLTCSISIVRRQGWRSKSMGQVMSLEIDRNGTNDAMSG